MIKTTKTKKGMASLYLTAFTTLLFGIVTLSFARVMLSESEQASNSDLSQSAYDSALAGIEDAKTALIVYKRCLIDSNSSPTGLSCSDVIANMESGWKSGSCDIVASVLGSNAKGEQLIGITSPDDPSYSDQAYTCVTITNDSSDYRAVLNESSRSDVVPVLTEGTKYQDVVGIELQWHSVVSDDEFDDDKFLGSYSTVYTNLYDENILPFGPKADATDAIPVLSFELFQTNENFIMSDLDLVREDNHGTDHAMITLYPTTDTTSSVKGKFISSDDLISVSNKTSSASRTADVNGLTPTAVTCGYDTAYRCRTTIEFPDPYYGNHTNRAKNTFFFRVSLPYGTPDTDFSIKLCTSISNGECNGYTDFVGVQSIVDSTGRANTLYRRIIARVNTTASAALYPEYAITSNGQNATIDKQFYVTENCWFTDGEGNSSTCANNGDSN